MILKRSSKIASFLFWTLFIVSSVSAQSEADGKVGAANQPDSPIAISGVFLARMPNESVRVVFNTRNIGTKAIRSAAFEAVDRAGGKQVSTGPGIK